MTTAILPRRRQRYTATICSVDGCENPRRKLTYCNKHYIRFTKHGDTSYVTPRLIIPAEARFWNRVNKDGPTMPHMETACWVICGSGYGSIKIDGEPVPAHRYSFFLANGYWPEPMCLHACDNPPCVNPEHLREGTGSDNARDMVERGRANRPKGRRLPIKSCSLPGCHNPSRRRTWCATHYARWFRHGDPLFTQSVGRPKKDLQYRAV